MAFGCSVINQRCFFIHCNTPKQNNIFFVESEPKISFALPNKCLVKDRWICCTELREAFGKKKKNWGLGEKPEKVCAAKINFFSFKESGPCSGKRGLMHVHNGLACWSVHTGCHFAVA